MNKAFATLGLPKTATPAEVKTRWRELAKVHHPDREGGNAVEFDTCRRAYLIALEEVMKPKRCVECNGTGKTVTSRGIHSIAMRCNECHGTGFQEAPDGSDTEKD